MAYDAAVNQRASVKSLKLRCFVIHLERASKRREQVASILRSCPIEAEVLDAVDGREVTQLECRSYHRRLHRPFYPFRLRNSEVATFLSHRKAWTRIVGDGLDGALVLEDDTELGEQFPAAFDLARRTLRPGDVIRFPVCNREQPGRIVAREGHLAVFAPRRVKLGMQGLLVGSHAAATLLERTETFDRPVDSALQMDWLTGVRMLTVMPAGLREVSGRLGGSLIGERKSLAEKMHREVMRPIYRWSIARRARKSTAS